ncbi:MAG TPA: hypothetical protein VNN17_05415 [Terriglobia bacterium]|nr:hypothetical protein [Terriglobia bacterium]
MSGDFLEMKRWVQQARGDAERARAIAEQTREDIKDLRWELEGQGRKASGSAWAAGIVAMALIAACLYGYYRLESDRSLLAGFPAVESSLRAMGQRVSTAEEMLRSWAGDWDGMNERLSKVERNSSAVLRQARDFATTQAAKVHQELQGELANRSQSLEKDLGELEAAQQQDQKLMANLRQEIAGVRQETAARMAQTQEQTGQALSDLRRDVNRNREEFAAVARNLDRQRLDFEIRKDRTTEVAPGLTLTLSGFNVSHQQVEGRLHLIADGRILWIRGQGIQQPVRFYSRKDDRPYEVVFTRVSKDGAIGYVLAPAADGAGAAAAAHSPDPALAQAQ